MAKKQQPLATPPNGAEASAKKKHVKKRTAAMREQERQARRAAWNNHAAPAASAEEDTMADPMPPVQGGAATDEGLTHKLQETAACAPQKVPAEEPTEAVEAKVPAQEPAETVEAEAPTEEPEPEVVAAWAPLEPEEPAPPQEPEPGPEPKEEEVLGEFAPESEKQPPQDTGALELPEELKTQEPPKEEPPAQEKTQPAPAGAPEKASKQKQKTERAHKEKKQRKRHYFATYVAIFTMLVVVVSAMSIVVMFSTSGNSLFANTPDVELPNFNNLTRAEVEQNPAYQRFHLIFEEVYNDEKAEGIIFDQSPKAPKQVKENASITLRVSKGVHRVTVPDVVGWKKDTVREKLKSLDLSILIKTEINKEKAVNTVLRTEPRAGATLQAGESVTVYVAGEPHDENVVNIAGYVGLSRDKAVKLIGSLGLVAQTRTVANGMPAGTVVAQTPAKGSSLRRGGTVMLSISSGSGEQLTGGQQAQVGQQLYPGGPTVGYEDGQVVPGSVSGHIHTWTAPDANGNQVCTVCAATRHVS